MARFPFLPNPQLAFFFSSFYTDNRIMYEYGWSEIESLLSFGVIIEASFEGLMGIVCVAGEDFSERR